MEFNIFKQDEIEKLELVDIKGGHNSDLETTQNGCPNEVAGCACTIVIK